jgi:rod shape determining protein RodA
MAKAVETSISAIDWITVSIYLGLVLTGWLMIYAVGAEATPDFFDLSSRHGNQLVSAGVALAVGAVVLIIDSRFYRTFAYIFYGLGILGLVAVLLIGTEIAGSNSWIVLGPLRLQPSEPAKFATCLGLAAYFNTSTVNLQHRRHQLIALGIVLAPMFLIILQGDAGSTLVYVSLLLVLFREGMPAPLYLVGITVTLLSIAALVFSIYEVLAVLLLLSIGFLFWKIQQGSRFWGLMLLLTVGSIYAASLDYAVYAVIVLAVLFVGLWVYLMFGVKKRNNLLTFLMALLLSAGYSTVVNYGFNEILRPHQQDRIKVWLKPSECDPLGALYNVTQSKMAIGSGGLLGKGFLEGTITKLDYVPEQVTDFIFCTVGEEHGFLGAFAVVMLFLILLMRIIVIAERQRSRFTRVYAYGVASILFFHLLVNIGMTMGLMPVIGIPLPFISYGGSSLVAFTILLAILVRLDADRFEVFR